GIGPRSIGAEVIHQAIDHRQLQARCQGPAPEVGEWRRARFPLICNALNDDENRGPAGLVRAKPEEVARKLSERLEICPHRVCQRGAHVASCPCSITNGGEAARNSGSAPRAPRFGTHSAFMESWSMG